MQSDTEVGISDSLKDTLIEICRPK